MPEMSLAANNALLTAHREAVGPRWQAWIRFAPGRWRAYAMETIRDYGVKVGRSRRGGAQPLGRQLAEIHRRPRNRRQRPKVHRSSAQPTWGVDVGAAAQIRGKPCSICATGGVRYPRRQRKSWMNSSRSATAWHVIAQGRLSPSDRKTACGETSTPIGNWHADVGILSPDQGQDPMSGPASGTKQPSDQTRGTPGTLPARRHVGCRRCMAFVISHRLIVGFILFTAMGKNPLRRPSDAFFGASPWPTLYAPSPANCCSRRHRSSC